MVSPSAASIQNLQILCYNTLMDQHFLQSSAWEKYEELEGHKTFRLNEKDFSALAILHSTPLGNYLFCPYGPTLKSNYNPNATLKTVLHSLSKLAREQNAFFVRIEPTFPLSNPEAKSLHLHKSHDLDPAHTWAIDLTQSREELLKQMRASSVQYWRSSAKKGLKIRQTKDPEAISILTSLLQAVSEKDHFQPQTEAHLKSQLQSGFATLYIAELDHQPLAASLVYDDSTTRFYAHAATSNEHRKINAGIVILIQMILDAKDRGAKIFDFWGITTSEDPKHPWYGFTKFKKSFGGYQINYAGTWDLPLSPIKYQLYRIIRCLNRLKRKITR